MRLYDGMAAFAADLGELAADVGGAAGEALIDRASAQVRAPARGAHWTRNGHGHCPRQPLTVWAWTAA